ncbi:PIH1 family [Powellomyces hirtus]|nr:PIH1 family [Powellomyces hirtus]
MSAFLAENDQQLGQLVTELQQRIAKEGGNPNDPLSPDAIPSTEIIPEPGFVVKTQNRKKVENWPVGLKVFINVCHSPNVPAPPLATNDEIRKALNAEDNAAYKVPLSLSSPKPDRDKSGKMCLVFDACVHTDPLNKSLVDFDFKLFLIELSLEWVEEKYKLELSREFTLPKLQAKGRLSRHIIRRSKRPIIAEVPKTPVTKTPTSATTKKPMIVEELTPRLAQPKYEVICEPSTGPPEYIIVQIQLPDVKSTHNATLDIEEKKLLLTVPNRYQLDAPLPAAIDTREGGAQFDRQSKVLTVTLKC